MRLRAAVMIAFVAALTAACGASTPVARATPASPSVVVSPTSEPTLGPPSPSTSPSPSPRPSSRVLGIAIDYQDHPLSCEAAALKMALAHAGIRTDEDTLLALIGRDTRPAVLNSRGLPVRWGNPNVSFVGDPDGKLRAYTGYGVYAAPIARVATDMGAQVLASGTNLPPTRGEGIPPATVYGALLDGHPVVAWISNTYHDLRLDSYTAFDGSTVWYSLTEHAVTLVGVRPDAVLINDPWYGQAWRSKAEFESAFHAFEEMAVIIE